MILSKQTLIEAIPHLSNQRVVVIGDTILDEYLTGTATRLSREAPIPVLEFENRRAIPGGAANPAMNIAALGSQAIQIGLIGDDAAGGELVAHLQAANIDTSGIIIDMGRSTTQKMRLMAQGSYRFPQQIARLDRIDRHPPNATTEAAIIEQIQRVVAACDAIIVSDYRGGMLTPAIIEAIRTEAIKHHSLLLVDTQGNLDKYHGYHIIRANQPDSESFLGHTLHTETDFQSATATLLHTLDAQGIVIGRGAQGVSAQAEDMAYVHFPPANVTEVFDVTGAGDTSIAVLALGLIVNLNLAEAALLANIAAGLVVQRLGNATLSVEGLSEAVKRW